MQGSSILSVNILETPKGIAETISNVYAVNNSNGVGISSVFSSATGIVTCILNTPITTGFTTPPFAVGDTVFVENIGLASTDGTGFNSEDYSYKFFPVTKYTNTNPAQVEFDLETTNPGVAVTDGLLHLLSLSIKIIIQYSM